jgi:hypothetical protein
MSKKNVIAEVSAEGLESVNEVSTIETSSVPQYDNIEWLKNNDPIFPAEFTSAKCKLDREPKVQAGLARIAEIDGDFPLLLMLLAKWWENKEARKEIKKMIDNEATEKGIDPVHYMQDTFRNFAIKYDGLADACDRMKYATTYFKPRGGVKDVFKQVIIKGETYNVNLRILAELKEKYPTAEEKEMLYAEVIAVSEKVTIEEL